MYCTGSQAPVFPKNHVLENLPETIIDDKECSIFSQFWRWKQQ